MWGERMNLSSISPTTPTRGTPNTGAGEDARGLAPLAPKKERKKERARGRGETQWGGGRGEARGGGGGGEFLVLHVTDQSAIRGQTAQVSYCKKEQKRPISEAWPPWASGTWPRSAAWPSARAFKGLEIRVLDLGHLGHLIP